MGNKPKSKKWLFWLLAVFAVNIALILFMFYGTITCQRSTVQSIVKNIEVKTNTEIYFDTVKFNITFLKFYNFKIKFKNDSAVSFDTLQIDYSFKDLVLNNKYDVNAKGENLEYKDASRVFWDVEFFNAAELLINFKGEAQNIAGYYVDFEARNITSNMENKFFFLLGQLLDVKSLKTSINFNNLRTGFKLAGDKFVLEKLELENKDIYVYGGGSISLAGDMNFDFNAKYFPASSGASLTDLTKWEETSLIMDGTIHNPEIKIK